MTIRQVVQMLAKKALTELALQKMKPAPPGKRKVVWDAREPGFAVRVTDKGKRTFVMVRRFAGKTHPEYRAIGEYGAISLDQARATARKWNELLAAGKDPAVESEREEEEKRRERARLDADTVDAVFDLFVRHHLAKLRSGKDVEAVMRRWLLPMSTPRRGNREKPTPVWDGRPITSIVRKDVIDVVYRLHDSGSPISANRLLAYIKTFFSFAVQRAKIDASPAALVKKPERERRRDRVLTDGEIRALWTVCGEQGAFGRTVMTMLVTGQRRDEVALMRWSELDLAQKLWTLPRDRTKADREHTVPLTELALRAIGEPRPKDAGFVFSTTGGKKAVNGWSKGKRKLDEAMLDELRRAAGERGEEPEGVTLDDWHLHDLRRTAATGMARLGFDRTVIGKCLNHADPGVTAVYDRHRYDDEKRAALAAWAVALERTVDPERAAVVPLGEAHHRQAFEAKASFRT
jgi:integrase